MASEADVQFRLSIWRDYEPPHRILLCDEQTNLQTVTSEHRLQAEVYSWSLSQDHFAGTADEARNRLRELLGALEVSRPPAERSLAALEKFVAAADKAIEDREAVSVPSGSGDAAAEINPLLSLVLHLKWVIRCFKDRPGVSVSIR